MKSLKTSLFVPTLILLWAMVYLFRLGEAQLKMDALTYATLAKHILSTGDWRVLHYTPSTMADFYMHPPLVMWMTAIAFKLFGVSVVTARAFSSLFALATFLLVYFWASRFATRWLGFVAVFVCLTTAPFVKFTADLFLDGPLAFFLVAGTIGVWQIARGCRVYLSSIAVGLCVAAAVGVKGTAGFSMYLVAVIALIATGSRRNLAPLGIVTLSAIVPLAGWVFGFGGDHYVTQYWDNAIASRLSARDFVEHLRPIYGLFERYWPWLPFFIYGIFRYLKNFYIRELEKYLAIGLCLFHAMVIVGAYAYMGFFYEHYFVGFYPFAAIVVAWVIAPKLERWQSKIVPALLGIAIVGNLALNLWPGRVRAVRHDPLRDVAPYVVKQCASANVKEILYTSDLADRWMGIAILAWETPWNVDFREGAGEIVVKPETLLVTGSKSPGAGWERVALAIEFPLVYEARGTGYCR